jgi:cation diffusion facilitator family transporter
VAGSKSRIAVLAALFGNLTIAIVKLIAGFVASSAAMFAEAAHSFSDVGNQFLLLLGIKKSTRPPDERYPYGTGKSAYFWPFLVAILLFGVAGVYSLLEGIAKVNHPEPLGDIRLALAVLAFGFVVEAGTLWIALRQASRAAKARGIRTVREFLAENRDATLLTVIVEDTLALVALPLAALALLLTRWTGNPVWDGWGSVLR